jgi:formamidopyrimidine-DNA glycosylase
MFDFITSLPHPYNKIGDGPEGPEVKHFTEKLNLLLQSYELLKIKIKQGPYFHSDKEKYSKFRHQVENFEPHVIKEIKCKGKWMYMVLYGPQYFAFGLHHGMEGSWCEESSNSHIILKFTFVTDIDNKKLYFQDVRRHGTFCLLTEDEFNKKLNELGPSVFDVDEQTFIERFKIKRIQNHRLCEVLLDQKVIAGVGNYMRADIMYLSKLSPIRFISSLSTEEISELYKASKKVAWDSYNAKATTVWNYESSIHRGNYDPLIYKKEISPENDPVETFQDKQKRTVHWIPNVQV